MKAESAQSGELLTPKAMVFIEIEIKNEGKPTETFQHTYYSSTPIHVKLGLASSEMNEIWNTFGEQLHKAMSNNES